MTKRLEHRPVPHRIKYEGWKKFGKSKSIQDNLVVFQNWT
ncbi:Uncharacterized protein dnm_033010 [Desulfonema magnum]|uniref:Uncharacterized protein n=1 Tax=Desulfonema magnum TaxID=45655 RepID=A0A975BKP8_9BACT|nr:Uncharacterized protein dnm_033010 [Desulfonema magnum]